MFAGMPGTGIGGIFYVLLAFLMPVHELWQLVRGRSSLARWRVIGLQVGHAAGVLGSIVGMSWLVRTAAHHVKSQPVLQAGLGDPGIRRIEAVTSVDLAWMTMAMLAAV